MEDRTTGSVENPDALTAGGPVPLAAGAGEEPQAPEAEQAAPARKQKVSKADKRGATLELIALLLQENAWALPLEARQRAAVLLDNMGLDPNVPVTPAHRAAFSVLAGVDPQFQGGVPVVDTATGQPVKIA